MHVQMSAGFIKVRRCFQQLDSNGDRLIDMGEFVSQAYKVGLDMEADDLKNVFDAADIDHSTKIGASRTVRQKHALLSSVFGVWGR